MKKIVAALLSLLFVFSACVLTVYGEETELNVFRINVLDKTADGVKYTICIGFRNIKTNVREEYIFVSPEDYKNNVRYRGVVSPGMYKIELDVPEEYVLRNVDGSEVSLLFNGNFDDRTLTYAVFDNEDYVSEKDEETEKPKKTMPELLETYINAVKKDASYEWFVEEFQKGKEASATGEDDFYWEYIYTKGMLSSEELFLRGKDFYDYTPEEAFLLTTTYVYVSTLSEAKLKDSSAFMKDLMWTMGYYFGDTGGESTGLEAQLAYYSLMSWSYKNYIETGKWYDFCKYLKTLGGEDAVVKAFSVDGETPYEPTQDEVPGDNSDDGVSKDASENDVATSKPSNDASDGIWDDTGEKVKNNAVTIIILFILLLIGAGIYIYRKKKNVDLLD